MHWLETLFGLSPDGGNGTTEAVYAMLAVGVAAFVVLLKARRKAR